MKKWSKRIGIAIAITIGLLLAWYLVVVFWQGSTKPILAVADKLQLSSSWKLTTNIVEPPKIICESVDVECPQVTRNWRSSDKLTATEFQKILNAAGWNFNIKGAHYDQPGNDKCLHICSADGTYNGYSISLVYTSPNIDEVDSLMYLYVHKD